MLTWVHVWGLLLNFVILCGIAEIMPFLLKGEK